MTYKPESGENINFDIESYDPPTSNSLSLISQEKYYVVPNADDVSFKLEQYSLENTDLKLTSRIEEGDSSEEESPNHYTIPSANVVNFTLKSYTNKTTELKLGERDTQEITYYYEIPLGSEVSFELKSYDEQNTSFDITPEREIENITNDLSVSISSKSRGTLFLDSTMKLPKVVETTTFKNTLSVGLAKFDTVQAVSRIEIVPLFTDELYILITSYSGGRLKLSEMISPKFESNSKFTTKINHTLKIDYRFTSQFNLRTTKGISLSTAEVISGFDILFTLNSVEEVLMILSPDFELIAYLEDYGDFVWNRRWRKVDDFELSINYEMKNAKYLQLGNYLAKKKGDVIHTGRIGSRNLKSEGDTQQLQISGKGLGEIFDSRIAFHKVNEGDGYDTFVGPAESAMRHYVDINAINPNDESRAVSRLKLEKDNQKGAVIHYKARFQKLSEILYEISKTTGLGWNIQLDLENQDFIFKVLKAKIRKGVRLSPNFESVQMINFRENKSELENTIMIAGQGEGSDRMVRTVSRNEV